jgi:hypothetical protein
MVWWCLLLASMLFLVITFVTPRTELYLQHHFRAILGHSVFKANHILIFPSFSFTQAFSAPMSKYCRKVSTSMSIAKLFRYLAWYAYACNTAERNQAKKHIKAEYLVSFLTILRLFSTSAPQINFQGSIC